MIEYKDNTFTNGFIEKAVGGKYEGRLSIEGIDISPIEGVYFKQGGRFYLFLKRQDVLEYDQQTKTYANRKASPYWECCLVKQQGGVVAYKGEFVFCRFKFTISAIWDKVMTDKDRLNLFVERVPMSEQVIINNINKRKRENKNININR